MTVRKVYGSLSGPPPCIVCKSEEHGHVVVGEHEYACPKDVTLPDASLGPFTVERTPSGAISVGYTMPKPESMDSTLDHWTDEEE